MTIIKELGQAYFIEVIHVTYFEGQTCVSDSIGGEACFDVSDMRIHRDLVRPNRITNVALAAGAKNITPLSEYTVYLRDFSTSTLTEISTGATLKPKDSVVFVHDDVFTPRNPYARGCSTSSLGIERVQARLASSAEILPARFVWP